MSDVTAAEAPKTDTPPAPEPETTNADTASEAPAPDGPVSETDWLQRRKQARAEPAPDAQDTPETPAEAAADAADEDTPTAEGGDAPQTDGPEETEADASGETTEGDFPETVTALAEALGFEPGEFAKGLQAQVTIDGETHNVPLEEALKGYQRRQDYDRSKGALAEERKAIQAEREGRAQELDARFQQVEALALTLQQQLGAGPDDAELAKLAETDPFAWAQAKQAREATQQTLLQTRAFLTQQRQEAEVKEANAKAQRRAEQQQKLAAKLPDVNDPQKLMALEGSITTMLTQDYGYTPEEVTAWFAGDFDHRNVLLLKDLAAVKQAQSKVTKVKPKLQKLPKPGKSGQARSSAQLAADGVRSAHQRLKSNGKVEDALALLKARRAARSAQHGGGKPQNYV